VTEESFKRLKALPRVEPDTPADSPLPDEWRGMPSDPSIDDKPAIHPCATVGDVEAKMAVHFAHDARDPDTLKRLAREKIERRRSGLEYEGARWGADDESECGAFPADKLAFGDLDAFRDTLAAEMMAADETLALEDARAKAMDILNPRNLRVANSHWSRWRRSIKHRRHNAKRNSEPEQRTRERERFVAYRKAHPEKRATRTVKLRQVRAARGPDKFVSVDSEGYDTGRYLSRLAVDAPIDGFIVEGDVLGRPPETERGWIERDREWYLAAHSDPREPNARNKTFDGDILREHKTFLWGAGNDEKREWLCRSVDGAPKVALQTEEVLDWIVGLKKKFLHSIFVSFAFSYDATQILSGLDYKTAMELQSGERRLCSDEEWEAYSPEERKRHVEEVKTVFWRGFAIAHRKGKMFKVGKLRNPDRPYKEIPCRSEERAAYLRERGMPEVDYADIDYAPGGEPVTIHDAFGFFQSSFLNALKGMNLDVTDEEWALLRDGKRNRGQMASLSLTEVQCYTGIELVMLARMMEKLRRGLVSQRLSLQRWQGAGAIAEAMFKLHRATHYSPYVATHDISEPQEFAHHAFFGGRIELAQQGKYVGDIHAYDVTSAYPSEMASLPAMALPVYTDPHKIKPSSWKKGEWTYLPAESLDRAAIECMSPYSIVELKFDFPSKVLDGNGRARDVPFYPLPYRAGKLSSFGEGSILFPAKGRGRYYRAEALAAFEWVDVVMSYAPAHVRARALTIECAYWFHPPKDESGALVYPYMFHVDYYEERRSLPKTDIREKVIKLGMNSGYGKMAQGVGGTKDRAPHSSNPWVAGATTAGTRAKLLRAALKAPWSVIFFATDGIHALVELGVESPTKTLGGWEKKSITAGIWAQPGVYAFSEIERGEIKFTGKSRGMSPKSFLPDDENGGGEGEDDTNEKLYDFFDESFPPLWEKGGGVLTTPMERYVTFGFAASSEENWAHAGCWLETTRTNDANSGGVKRERCTDRRRASGLVPLIVKANDTPEEMSAPHEPDWLDDDERVAHDWAEDMKEIAATWFEEPVGLGLDFDE
jgi:hypothetical protein